MLHNETVYTNGDGEINIGFCFIDNTVQENILSPLIDNPDATDQVYSLALNDRTNSNQLFNPISDELKERITDLDIADPVYKEFRTVYARHYRADISKAQTVKGYGPGFTFDQRLKLLMAGVCIIFQIESIIEAIYTTEGNYRKC